MPDMTLEMAREIVKTGLEHKVWEEAGQTPNSIPEKQAFTDAAELVQLSRQSYDNGSRNDTILDILFAGQVEPTKPGEFDDVYAKHDQQPPAPAAAPSEPAATPDGQAPSVESIYPGYDDQKAKDIVSAIKASAASGDLTKQEWEQIKAYEAAGEERKSILDLDPEFKAPESKSTTTPSGGGDEGDYGSVDDLKQAYESGSLGTDRVRQENLPIPQQYSAGEPVLPVDITAISHQDLSRMAMQFHSLEARELWLLSQEEGRKEACASLRSDAHRSAFARHFERIKGGLEKPTATAVQGARSEANSEADADSSVVAWRNRETRHSIEARSLKALVDGHERASARLSREQTRREKLAGTPTGS